MAALQNGNGHATTEPALNMLGVPEPQPKAIPNGTALHREGLRDLDPSLLKITLAPSDSLKAVPATEDLVFGDTKTDHMLVCTFHPQEGWGIPEIKPYAPLSLDPSSSCFQYCPTVFEGMKAYLSPDGEPLLFRPQLNMARMQRSIERVALPHFNPNALLVLLQKLVSIERRWIPNKAGCSLYIRPTIIGTRPSLGVHASDHALLYAIVSPTGPYFRTGPKAISLLGVHEHARSWPGGTGGFKLGLNYAPGFLPQRMAAAKGYQQVLWLLNDADRTVVRHDAKTDNDTVVAVEDNTLSKLRVTEAGAMNFFVVRQRSDGGMDVITPPLDGVILPGITRQSCMELAASHPEKTLLPGISASVKLHLHEQVITLSDLVQWGGDGTLLEAFCAGTAVIVCSVGRIGYTTSPRTLPPLSSPASAQQQVSAQVDGEVKDIILPVHGDGGLGPVARGLHDRLIEIQEGKVSWDGWSVRCE